MKSVPLTRAGEFIHVIQSIERLGESPAHLLCSAHVPMWQDCNRDDLVPKNHIFRVMEEGARCLNIPDFGLQVGMQTNLASMGSYGRLVAGAVSIHDALATGSRWIHLHNSGSRLFSIAAGDEIWFCHKESAVPDQGCRQKEQYVLIRMIDHVRLGAGRSWLPAKVCLQTHSAPGEALRKALGDPQVRIGQDVTAIALPRPLLALPLRWNATAAEATDALESRLRATRPAADFPGSLRQVAGTLLKMEGPPRIETMAEIAGLSVRSLQRRLADYGLSHFEIIDQARYQAAVRLLEDAQIRITDIAMDLGYTDSAHFTRAFKRWAGVTPREYRRFPVPPRKDRETVVH